ncbi:hypothetical protein [Streptomyces pseudogriseolus]|uniref:hypothetical protein n=1 Tax=Streptomyces pseudogriseolus TaxID=36817 RepID=UPI003FA21763
MDALRLQHLLRRLVDDGKPHLLGDPGWVGRAVAGLTGGKNSRLTQRSLRQAVTETLETAGARHPLTAVASQEVGRYAGRQRRRADQRFWSRPATTT